MKVSRRNWFYRFATWGWVSAPNTLCALFWRAVFKVLLAAVAAFYVYAIALVIYAHPLVVLVAVLGACTLIGVLILIINYNDAPRIRNSLAWQAVKSVKGKLCPLIEVVD